MSWRDRLEPASFRGVEFYVDSDDMVGGRRTVVHEYPNRETALVEDTGGAAKEMSFDGYVLGSDYLDKRDALLDALDTSGAGQLVHPLYKVRNVQSGKYSVRILKSEGGIARFSLQFTETDDPQYPVATSDAKTAVGDSADAAAPVAGVELVESLDVSGLPQWAVDKTKEVMALATQQMAKAMAFLDAADEQLSIILKGIAFIETSAEALIRAPSAAVGDIQAVFNQITGSSASAKSKSDFFDAFYTGFSTTPEQTTTDTRKKVEANRLALDSYFHQLALIQFSKIAPFQSFDSISDAEIIRDKLGGYLDAEAESASDDIYYVLTAIRADLMRAIPDQSARLPNIVTKTLAETTPAVVLAYRFYADAERDSEIVARNKIGHPGFVGGGVPIEVLTNE
jgi:prophage DNA circulation protein